MLCTDIARVMGEQDAWRLVLESEGAREILATNRGWGMHVADVGTGFLANKDTRRPSDGFMLLRLALQ